MEQGQQWYLASRLPYPPIKPSYRDRRGHLQQPLHTADYFVFRYRSAGWEECKPIEKLIQFAQQHSTRYVLDEKGTWRCPPGETFAARYGLTYRVRASDQINWAVQDNWLYLDVWWSRFLRTEKCPQRLFTSIIGDIRVTPVSFSPCFPSIVHRLPPFVDCEE